VPSDETRPNYWENPHLVYLSLFVFDDDDLDAASRNRPARMSNSMRARRSISCGWPSVSSLLTFENDWSRIGIEAE